MADMVLPEKCRLPVARFRADIQAFLPWNISEEKKEELSDTDAPEGDDTS